MENNVKDALRPLEEKHGCTFLFAAESGSRAWGFASPDSDYDIRAIYVKPLDWYLTTDPKPRDTIEAMLPGDLDVSAWELRKTLRLFVACNLSLNEWLTSPILYFSNQRLLSRLLELLPQCFNPIKATHHYLNMANSVELTLALILDGGKSFPLKRLFYVLRGTLAAKWCCRFQTMPPVLFTELLQPEIISGDLISIVNDLLARKREAVEEAVVDVPKELCHFCKQTSKECLEQAPNLKRRDIPMKALDGILQEMVKSQQ